MAIQIFTRGVRPVHRSLLPALKPLFPDTRFSVDYATPGEVRIDYAGNWGAIDTGAIQAAIDAADDDTPQVQARDEIETDIKFKALVLWVAQLHGKTPAEARAEVRAILQGLT